MIIPIKVQQRSYVTYQYLSLKILNLKYIKLATIENIFTQSSNKNTKSA